MSTSASNQIATPHRVMSSRQSWWWPLRPASKAIWMQKSCYYRFNDSQKKKQFPRKLPVTIVTSVFFFREMNGTKHLASEYIPTTRGLIVCHVLSIGQLSLGIILLMSGHHQRNSKAHTNRQAACNKQSSLQWHLLQGRLPMFQHVVQQHLWPSHTKGMDTMSTNNMWSTMSVALCNQHHRWVLINLHHRRFASPLV